MKAHQSVVIRIAPGPRKERHNHKIVFCPARHVAGRVDGEMLVCIPAAARLVILDETANKHQLTKPNL